MIKHADLIAPYTETYFYVFSYDGIMGNVNVTIEGKFKLICSVLKNRKIEFVTKIVNSITSYKHV